MPYALLIILISLFGIIYIGDFSTPLFGIEDTNSWEYIGYYFYNNFKLIPFPHLNFINNQTFYPYGTNHVFQAWGFERDIFYSIFYHFFKHGSWLKIYYLLTIYTLVLGSFFILKKDFPTNNAFFISILVFFFNFYAINKYPNHLNIAVFHWTGLSLITDFLIINRAYNNKYISLKLIFFRILLLILSLGQDLGYIAGFSLTSFILNLIFLSIIKKSLFFNFKKSIKYYQEEIISSSKIIIILSIFIILISYLYIPLIFNIIDNVNNFPKSEISQGAYWANPIRMFIPYFPLNTESLLSKLGDVTESIYDARISIFIIIIGILGLISSYLKDKKSIIMFYPFLIILFLCLVYHPIISPTLKIFPWFSFNRVGGRSTFIYTIIFSLFALNINFEKSNKFKFSLFILSCIGFIEFFTAYSSFTINKYDIDNNFYNYMNSIKEHKGEAVLDFPFCVAGGNGIGSKELCPFYNKTNGIYTLKRFHNKKVMGQYFGRLHKSQINSYIESGWNKLFFPNNKDIQKANKQIRCFNDKEWFFFEEFYLLNDFSGINLYTDFFDKQCIQEFYTKFGNPVIETIIPIAGKTVFISKTDIQRNKVNIFQGKKVKFKTFFDEKTIDLLSKNNIQNLDIKGLSDLENNIKWGLGDETNISFNLNKIETINLEFSLINKINNQEIEILYNNKTINKLSNIKQNEKIHLKLNLKTSKENNTITFKYKYYFNFKIILKHILKSNGITNIIKLNEFKNEYRKLKNKSILFNKLEISKNN